MTSLFGKADGILRRASKARVMNTAREMWQSQSVVVMNVRGTNINDMNQVRWAMLPAGGKAKRIKNTLAKIALNDMPKRQPIQNIIHGNVIFLYLGTGSDPMEIFRVGTVLDS